MKVHPKRDKNRLKTEPLSHLALTHDFLGNGKEVDLRTPDNGKVYGDTQTINTARKDEISKRMAW